MKYIIKYSNIALALILLMGFGQSSFATHIVGGDITYKCLGENDAYEITLTVRRDCLYGADDAQFDTPLYLTIFNGENQFMIRRGDNGYVPMEYLGQDTVYQDLESGCITQGGEICVHEAKYKGTVILPFEKSGYILAYQRCCRNQTLTNIIDPLSTGATYFSDISPLALETCNNGPSFRRWPPIYVCADRPLVIDHSAIDVDGDKLVYEFCTPSSGATLNEPKPVKTSDPPFDTILWKAPYSVQNLLGGVPLKIDPNTGVITGTPNLLGQFLVGVCVKEYRNGQLISVTRRDFEFNVRPCVETPVADFDVVSDPCDGLEQRFKNKTTGAGDFTWYFDSENDRTKTSKEKDPTFKYDKPGTYKVVLIANNEQCLDSIIKEIVVYDPDINVDFDIDFNCESELKISLFDKSTGNDDIVSWQWLLKEGSKEYRDSLKDVMFILEKGGQISITLTVTDSNGCEGSLTRDTILPTVEIDLIGDSISICLGDSVFLLKNGNPMYNYQWRPLTYLDTNPPHNPVSTPLEDITYYVTVSNGICTLEDSIYIMVRDTFPVMIIGEDTTCDGSVKLTAISDSTDMFEWSKSPDFDIIIGTTDVLMDNITKTTTYYVRAGKVDDCRGVASFTVVYGELDVTLQERYIICDGGGMLVLNANGDSTLIYSWTPGKYLDDSTKYNPKGTFTHTVVFKVHVYDPEFPQCGKDFMVTVFVSPSIEIIGLPNDTSLCDQDSLELEIHLNIEDANITWCDEDGNVFGKGRKIIITPPDSGYIIVKVIDSLGCDDRDSIFIRNYDLDIDVLFPEESCVEDSIMLEVVNNNNVDIKVTWTIHGDEIMQNKITILPKTKDDIYYVKVEYGDSCLYEEVIKIDLLGFDSIHATADPTKLELGREVQLDVDAEGADIYAWKPERIIDDPSIQDPIAKPDSIGIIQFIIKVTDVDGCMAWDTVSVEVIPLDCVEGVFLPNAFSPNGDLINDVLRVRSNVILDMELLIYDRWGEEVYHSNSQTEVWDGNYGGDVLGPDVYNYYLTYTCIDGNKLVKIGNINLIK